VPVPYVDERAAELVFRHKVMSLLQGEGLLSEERTRLLLSWRHTGFSVHNRVRVEPEDGAAVERLARYIMRPPISLERLECLERLEWDGSGVVRYHAKPGHDKTTRYPGDQGETIDAAEFLARVLMHIPEPRRHLVRYYGWYSNVLRGKRNRLQQELAEGPSPTVPGSGPTERDHSPGSRALRRRWAEMIKRVCEVDPLVCPRCHGEMRIIAFIVDAVVVIDKIIRHLAAKGDHRVRGPPRWAGLEAAS
jgi:hypothetical protein